jgi:uncharacterized protein involved in propanediol utilization
MDVLGTGIPWQSYEDVENMNEALSLISHLRTLPKEHFEEISEFLEEAAGGWMIYEEEARELQST